MNCGADQIWKLRRDKHISSFVSIAREIVRISQGGCDARNPAKNDETSAPGRVDTGYRPSKAPPPTPDPPKAEGSSGQLQEREQQPVEQQDTVHPKNSKDDFEAIGNRKVGNGPNFYSLEKEIALGKQLAQEVERSSKLIDDPVVTEYVN